MDDKICLLVAPADDIHALAVAKQIRRVSDGCVRPVFLDVATFPIGSRVSLRFGLNGKGTHDLRLCRPLPSVYGSEAAAELESWAEDAPAALSFQMVSGVWWRRPRPPVVSKEISAPEFQRYAAVNTTTVIRALVAILSEVVPVINLPVVEARVINKPYQLRCAERVGLPVPETLITQDQDEVRSFVADIRAAGGEVILKPVATTQDATQSTQRLDQDLQQCLSAAALCPTIFQRYIEGLDLRITVVGDQVFTMVEQASGECDPVDIRLDFKASRRSFRLIPEHEKKILELHRSLGLAFGAYDCKLDSDGALWFLEVNPSGQWLWAEVEARLPISECLARALCFGFNTDIAPRFAPLTETDVSSFRGEPMNVVYARAMKDRMSREPSRI